MPYTVASLTGEQSSNCLSWCKRLCRTSKWYVLQTTLIVLVFPVGNCETCVLNTYIMVVLEVLDNSEQFMYHQSDPASCGDQPEDD